MGKPLKLWGCLSALEETCVVSRGARDGGLIGERVVTTGSRVWDVDNKFFGAELQGLSRCSTNISRGCGPRGAWVQELEQGMKECR